MLNRWIFMTLIWLLNDMAQAYRECYHCDSRLSFDSADACSMTDPVTRLLNRFKFMDGDECYRCVKQITPSGHVYRGCISKPQYKTIDQYFSSGETCSSKVPMPGTRLNFKEYCKCRSNKCNDSTRLRASPAFLLVSIAALICALGRPVIRICV